MHKLRGRHMVRLQKDLKQRGGQAAVAVVEGAPRAGGHIAGTGGATLESATAREASTAVTSSTTGDTTERPSKLSTSTTSSSSGSSDSISVDARAPRTPQLPGTTTLVQHRPARERQVPPTPQVLSRRFAMDMASEDGTIIVTVAAAGKLDLLLNWVGHLDKLDVKSYIVGAADEQEAQQLAARGIPVFLLDDVEGRPVTDVDPAAWSFSKRLGRQKVGLAKAFLDYGLTQVVLSDCDSVWRRDALAYAAQHGDGADILVASNHLTPLGRLGDVGLEVPGNAMGPFDTGLVFLRNTPHTSAFVDAWLQLMLAGSYPVDTHAFNDMLMQGWVNATNTDSRADSGSTATGNGGSGTSSSSSSTGSKGTSSSGSTSSGSTSSGSTSSGSKDTTSSVSSGSAGSSDSNGGSKTAEGHEGPAAAPTTHGRRLQGISLGTAGPQVAADGALAADGGNGAALNPAAADNGATLATDGSAGSSAGTMGKGDAATHDSAAADAASHADGARASGSGGGGVAEDSAAAHAAARAADAADAAAHAANAAAAHAELAAGAPRLEVGRGNVADAAAHAAAVDGGALLGMVDNGLAADAATHAAGHAAGSNPGKAPGVDADAADGDAAETAHISDAARGVSAAGDLLDAAALAAGHVAQHALVQGGSSGSSGDSGSSGAADAVAQTQGVTASDAAAGSAADAAAAAPGIRPGAPAKSRAAGVTADEPTAQERGSEEPTAGPAGDAAGADRSSDKAAAVSRLAAVLEGGSSGSSDSRSREGGGGSDGSNGGRSSNDGSSSDRKSRQGSSARGGGSSSNSSSAVAPKTATQGAVETHGAPAADGSSGDASSATTAAAVLDEPSSRSRLFGGWNGKVSVGVLPITLFPSGHVYFVQRLHELANVEPLVVRTTHQFGGVLGKRHRLRDACLFEDAPGYFHDRQRYVSFEIPIAPNIGPQEFDQLSVDKMAAYHRKGLELQLEQFFRGAALAVALGRVLVLPKFVCYCDKHWTELARCRMPGAKLERLPFLCPLDHVVDPSHFDDGTSELTIAYKESSFLDNPRAFLSLNASTGEVTAPALPSAYATPPKRRQLTIWSRKDLTVPKEEWRLDSGGLTLHLPQELSQAVLAQHLAPYGVFDVWHFRNPLHVMKGFDSPAKEEEFKKRTQHLKPMF